MSDSQPSHSDLLQALHHHDVRLVRLESKVDSLDKDVEKQAGRMDKATEKLEQLAEAVAALEGTQRMIFWLVATLLPVIASLQVWDHLFS